MEEVIGTTKTHELNEKSTTKLKRTLESGHSYEGDITFDTPEEMRIWWEEDKLYED